MFTTRSTLFFYVFQQIYNNNSFGALHTAWYYLLGDQTAVGDLYPVFPLLATSMYHIPW